MSGRITPEHKLMLVSALQAFMTLALAQILHLGNARSDEPVFQARRVFANPYALAAVGVSVGLQLMAWYYGPVAAVLRLAPLDPADWG